MSYQPEDPVAFVTEQGWPHRRVGDELETTCPFCQKPKHLYINVGTGLWKCQRCGEQGNLFQLRQRLGLGRPSGGGARIQSLGYALRAEKKRIPVERVDAMQRALLADEEALAYCTTVRCWSLDAIKRMRVGLRIDTRGKWIAYPWMRRGECLGIKYRILPDCEENYPARFDREPGCESILFNEDALDHHDEIIVASGEGDLMAVLTLGFENVVATTTGEGTLPASGVDRLMKKPKVLVTYDNDSAGQKGARDAGKRLGVERTWLVTLPQGIHDANEFLTNGGTHDEFAHLIASAQQLDVPTMMSLSQALDRLEEEKAIGSWDDLFDSPTPWPTVNKAIGQWHGGNQIVVSGPQGTGKTTLCLNIATHHAASGAPVLFYCLEMSIPELVQHVLCAHYQLPEDQITANVIARARHDLAEWPLYLGANPRADRKEVLDLLGQAVRRYGLRLVFFDNLHVLARSIEHRTEEVGVISKAFKLFAQEYEIPLVLIAQPRKLEPGRIMTPWDLKDSVDLFSDADQILILHREQVGSLRDGEAVAAAHEGDGDVLSPMTLVRLAKARHRRSKDMLLFFVGGEHRFREITPGDAATLPESPAHDGSSGRGQKPRKKG